MKLRLESRPRSGPAPKLNYTWDAESEILGARISRPDDNPCAAVEGVVQISAPQGAWMYFEVVEGRLSALEIALWPELEAERKITPVDSGEGFSDVEFVACDRPVRAGSVVGFTTPIKAVPDNDAKTLELRFGSARAQKGVRVADSLIVGTDSAGKLARLWLLNVPGYGQPLD